MSRVSRVFWLLRLVGIYTRTLLSLRMDTAISIFFDEHLKSIQSTSLGTTPLLMAHRRAEDRAGGEGEGGLPSCARSEPSSEAIA